MRTVAAVAAFALLGCSRHDPATAPTLTQSPLPVRAPVDGARFQRLDDAATGLDFTNELRRENTVGYVYSGAGVAVGDYDADGLPDVYLVSQDGQNKLFRQAAPMRFVDVTAAAGGLGGGEAWGTAAAFADVDGDGDLDLYVCNLESKNLLYLNVGNGTFREAAREFGLDLAAASTGVAFADCDNDGDLDVYVLTNRLLAPLVPPEIVAEVTLPKDVQRSKAELFPPWPQLTRDGKAAVPPGYEDFFAVQGGRVFTAGQVDRLFRNDGKGRFSDVTEASGLLDHGNGLSVVWWDCDDDGWLDLYIGNDLHSPDRLWRNLRNGRFEDITRQALPHTAFFGMGCDFGDIDNDGRFDLCVADMSSTTHYMGKLLMGNMGTHRWFLENADPPQYMRNAVYCNTGTGRFLEAGHLTGLASTDWTWSVRFADLDEDMRLDFFATNGIPVFTDDPDVGRRFNSLWEAGQKQQALDLYRNLRRIDERNIARRNLGGLRFEDAGAQWGLDELGVGHGAVVVDLDRDGDLDVLVNNLNRKASLFENRTAGTHRVLVQLAAGGGNTAGIGSRITLEAGGVVQTRLLMPTRGYMSAGDPVEHFGLGAAATIDRLEVRWPSGRMQEWRSLAADCSYTLRESALAAPVPAAAVPAPLFVPGPKIAVRHAERPFDDYAVQPLLPHRLSQLGPGVACGDVDGDGRDDVWMGGAAGQAGTLLRARGDGTFAATDGPWSADAECEDMGACLFDFDGDGDLDLYVVSGGVEAGAGGARLADRLYRNEGAGRFVAAPATALPECRDSGSCCVAADYDGDGDLDLFVGGRVVPGRFPAAPPSRLLRNDGGVFTDVTAEVAPGLQQAGMVTAAVWADLDDDHWPDLVVAAQWQPLRLLHNRAGKAFEDRSAASGVGGIRGLWNGIDAGDLDGDGDLDLVATNLGLNTKYKASTAGPMHLFANDLDGNGTFDVIETKQQAGRHLPVRGLSCSSEAMPFLAQKFPTYDAFARATIGEIYEPARLAQCLEVTANELRHMVFENRGDHFLAHPLPHLAQVSIAFGIGIVDVDADGHSDLVLAHNSFSPEPETGRFDGGLGIVLRNGGAWQFEPLPAARSGLVAPGDHKGVVVTDVDGDQVPDLVLAQNNGPPVVLLSRQRTAGLAVQLRGPAGNPTAIGARVTLVRPDGSRQVHEVRAGGGYLSQGSAAAFLGRADAGSAVEVRWPGGRTTRHPLDSATGALVLSP